MPFFIVAVHFSSSATTVLSIVIALLWLMSGGLKTTGVLLGQNPPVLYALLLLAFLTFSMLYSLAPWPEAMATLSKYRKLLLLPLLLPFLSSDRQRARCEVFLLASLITILLVTIGIYLSTLASGLNDYLLKHRITYGLFMAFLGFYCLHQIYQQRRWTWLILLLLVCFNLFVVFDGRTGQLVFLLLWVLFLFQVLSFRKAVILSFAVIAAFTLFLLFSSHSVRFWQGINESIHFYHNDAEAMGTSMGFRLSFWTNALAITGQSPWYGVGIGGIPYKFGQIFPGDPLLINPHNEYLLIAAQLGLSGLLLFVAFLLSILRQATRLPETQRWLLQGLWLALCVSCLFNSSIFDFTVGHWFMVLIALYSFPVSSGKTAAPVA